MNVKRTYEPITINDLKKLRELALSEHEDFFKRNPHLTSAYRNSLVAICLCQGAASHYLNNKIGINDFDIWHFYVENNVTKFPYRAHKRLAAGYKGKPIDFLKRTIPKDICSSNNPDQILMKYLLQKNTNTKRLLLKQAIIGLFPDKIFSKVIWTGSGS